MKEKIAILTQPLGENYGGIIQNYALQKFLEKNGHEVITINRVADHPHSKIKIHASRIKSILKRKILGNKDPKFLLYENVSGNNLRFMKKNLKLSPVIDSTSTLIRYFKKHKFDAVIVGSDQVWRPKYSQNIWNYFLDFLENNGKVKKIAYAASFGTEDWEYTTEETLRCSQLIQNFDGVSVREDSGVSLCRTFLNRHDVVHLLDPTLLLDKKDYDLLITDQPTRKGMFTYVLDHSIKKSEFLKSCAAVLNLEIFTNQLKYKTDCYGSNNIEDYIIPPLEGWLQGFRDADFVLTDSFHGSIFSIINQKPFFALVNKGRGASRFESIFKQLGIEDRLIYNIEDFNPENLKNEIDYEKVNGKLSLLKDESIKFLKYHFPHQI